MKTYHHFDLKSTKVCSRGIKRILTLIFCAGLIGCMNFAADAQSVKIYPQTIRVQKGKTKTITAAAYNASAQGVFNATFTFSNSNASVAGLSSVLVSSGGSITVPSTPPPNLRTITGLAAGTTTVSATWNGRTSPIATIIVDDPAAAPAAIVRGDNDPSGSTVNTKVGEAIELNADESRGVSKIEWEWGDGDKTTELTSATHAYLQAGMYNLRVTVTNTAGQSNTKLITVNVTPHAETRVINVTTVAQLVSAYNSATGGEHIVIPAGTVLSGQIVLPAKSFSDYVTIRSSAIMPDPRDRVSPTQAGLVTVRASAVNGIPLTIEKGASKIRIIGLKLEPRYLQQDSGPAAYYLAQIGEAFSQVNASENPSKIIMQHCVINPANDVNVVHAILNDGYKVSVISSWIGNVKTFDAQDSQAIVSFDGRGAHVYNNNFLEAASENIMYGGVQNSIEGLTPTNIEVRRCHITKRLSWRVYANGTYRINVKNLLETKNGRRIYIEGTVFENHWDADRGQRFAFALHTGASPGVPGEFVPWVIGEEIVFENSKLSRMYGVVNTGVINDYLDPFHGLKTNTVIFKNMLFDDLSHRWGMPGVNYGSKFLQPNNVEDMTVDHVTVIDRDDTLTESMIFATNNNFRIKVTNSIFSLGEYGIGGVGVGGGMRALNPGTDGLASGCTRPGNASWTISHNIMPRRDNDISCYPQAPYNNSYPTNYAAIGFVDFGGGNFQLASNSPYRGRSSSGADPGVNSSVLNQRTSCSVSGSTISCLQTPGASSFRISGRVTKSAGGRGLQNVVVEMTGSQGGPRFALTNSSGYFRFPAVAPGDYLFRATSKTENFTPINRTVAAEVADMNFIPN